jgi:hypothetical protein
VLVHRRWKRRHDLGLEHWLMLGSFFLLIVLGLAALIAAVLR